MKIQNITSRNLKNDPLKLANDFFKSILKKSKINDVLFADSSFTNVIAMAGLKIQMPCIIDLFKKQKVERLLRPFIQNGHSLLLTKNGIGFSLYKRNNRGVINRITLGNLLQREIFKSIRYIEAGAGCLNENGDHLMDLTAPNPGPHFSVNLLLGNRMDFNYPIQTTPKSVVDRLGGGSFRSHAFTQVLATRWDLRQEENGFPANRQFYLVEDGEMIFYSNDPQGPNIESAWCRHSQNCTEITYKTKCGLLIVRTIILLSQIQGLPLATEAQRITIKNSSDKKRILRIVYTGMFGSEAASAMWEDVLYSNIIMQARIIKNGDGSILALTDDYYPEKYRTNIRFSTLITYDDSRLRFPLEFCTNYNDFVGRGSLGCPDGLNFLPNRISRVGPGFFAMALPVTLEAKSSKCILNFTGLVSAVDNPHFSEGLLEKEVTALLNHFKDERSFDVHMQSDRMLLESFQNYLQIKSGDANLNTYINKNLPFQILYQTFVSRSFSQTQKGYRELGFREIQDLFAAMYYFAAMGKSGFVRQVILTWCRNVYDFGYTNHNFFWKGKEPGQWSDDGLWLVQAVYRYIQLTGDLNFMETTCEIAGSDKIYSVYEILKKIIRYSSEVSVGAHGLPLIDKADWNDCLKVDVDYLTGPEKEKLYNENPEKAREALAKYSESVMNAFLLKVVIDNMKIIAELKGEKKDSDNYKKQAEELYNKVQRHAWKNDFFARILFNRSFKEGYTFLGAGRDGLSANHDINGTYFINSFSWSILSDCASDDQIKIMLDRIEKYLKTPSGYRLCTEVDLNKISPLTATGHYFPGDRENTAVFKHASMMAVSAMFKAAKSVREQKLARRLANAAYWMLEKVLPYKTMQDPYKLKGNPRFCTQYINTNSGEHIGPELSGTASWLALSIFACLGIEYQENGILCDPILEEEVQDMSFELKTKEAAYDFIIKKPKGFYRYKDRKPLVFIDEKQVNKNLIPFFSDAARHKIIIDFCGKRKNHSRAKQGRKVSPPILP